MNKCPDCGSEYKSLGHHYSRSDCKYPSIDGKLKEKLTGILMGDGCISERNKYPYMRIEMTNKKFLDGLNSQYPHIFGSVRKHQTSEQRAERDRNSGWNEKADKRNYSDVYVVQTYSNPDLKDLSSWYRTGEKVFPEVELTPTILKYWYCCDGNMSDYEQLRIGCSNEIENVDKIKQLFSDMDVSVNFDTNQIWFTKKDSNYLYDYMGVPVKGFKYKWPKQYCGDKR